jgi:hypothetical protein
MKDLIIEQKPTHAARPRLWTDGLIRTYQAHDHKESSVDTQNRIKRYGDSRWRTLSISFSVVVPLLCRQSILIAAQSTIGFNCAMVS